MATVSGDVAIRVGSQDPVTLQLLEDDGVTPIDLTGITALKVRFRDSADDAYTKTIEDPVVTISDATTGKIIINQSTTDFTAAKRYYYYVEFKDAAGKQHFIPEDKNYTWTITEVF